MKQRHKAGLFKFVGTFILLSTAALFSLDKDLDLQKNRTVLRVGYSAGAFSRGFLTDAQVVLESLGTSIAKRSTDSFSMVTALIYEEFSAFHRAIEQKEVDVVIMSTLDYLTLEKRGFLEPALVGSSSVGIMREYVFLTREDRAVSDITQMSGMSISVETGGSGRTPLIWLDVFLSQQQCSESDAFFKEVNHVEKASQAVLPVFFNKVDGCLTTMSGFQTMVELNPQLGRAFRIVARSPKLLRGVICFRAGYDEELKNTVIDVLKSLHEDPDGQQILVVMREEEVVPFQPQYLESTRELYRHYQSAGGDR